MRVHLSLILVTIVVFGSANSVLGRHPDKTGDPRPDFLPHPFYNHWSSYRADNNRPSFLGGWMAYVVAKPSQEAMAWQENHLNGTYHTHRPTPVRMYLYPKPWEVLPINSRKDEPMFTDASQINAAEMQAVPEGYQR